MKASPAVSRLFILILTLLLTLPFPHLCSLIGKRGGSRELEGTLEPQNSRKKLKDLNQRERGLCCSRPIWICRALRASQCLVQVTSTCWKSPSEIDVDKFCVDVEAFDQLSLICLFVTDKNNSWNTNE